MRTRTIQIPTVVRQTDLVKQVGEERARQILEQIWLATHPFAARLLRHPLTKEQLGRSIEFARGQQAGRGVNAIIPVIAKWFMVDEAAAARFLSFVDDELAAAGEKPSDSPGGFAINGNGHNKPQSEAALEARRANIAKGRARRAKRLKEARRGQ